MTKKQIQDILISLYRNAEREALSASSFYYKTPETNIDKKREWYGMYSERWAEKLLLVYLLQKCFDINACKL